MPLYRIDNDIPLLKTDEFICISTEGFQSKLYLFHFQLCHLCNGLLVAPSLVTKYRMFSRILTLQIRFQPLMSRVKKLFIGMIFATVNRFVIVY